MLIKNNSTSKLGKLKMKMKRLRNYTYMSMKPLKQRGMSRQDP